MSSPGTSGVTVRIVREEDAEPFARVVAENRDFLQPWEPIRGEEYFSVEGQRRMLDDALLLYSGGILLPCTIIEKGEVVGRININNIIRGALQSGDIGYWVAESAGGRGVATAAVAGVVRIAFDTLGLHRLAASTLVNNVRSQRVLEKNGFERIGMAPKFLKINGTWSDSVLFQRLNEAYD
ncbi:GNAT family protein [Kineosporia sp. NBRC 101731]|uniref:GNAT family N-acetyltransferase n=1 Tax=Kineosporia sp. NBRC 101731 TaxID=3032199 RepID=UPI0025558FFB|nr:GNAT family protein [Kineosporia sp. NBRC 101731]